MGRPRPGLRLGRRGGPGLAGMGRRRAGLRFGLLLAGLAGAVADPSRALVTAVLAAIKPRWILRVTIPAIVEAINAPGLIITSVRGGVPIRRRFPELALGRSRSDGGGGGGVDGRGDDEGGALHGRLRGEFWLCNIFKVLNCEATQAVQVGYYVVLTSSSVWRVMGGGQAKLLAT